MSHCQLIFGRNCDVAYEDLLEKFVRCEDCKYSRLTRIADCNFWLCRHDKNRPIKFVRKDDYCRHGELKEPDNENRD